MALAAFVPEALDPPEPDPLPRKPVMTLPRLAMPEMPGLSVPSIPWPRLSVPPIAWRPVHLPAIVIPRLRPPRVSRLVVIVAAVLAILLIAPLAYVLLPAIRPVAARQASESQPATNGVTPAANSPQAMAIAGVKAKTGLPYAASRCASSGPCLTIARETLGQDAAAVLFSTAGTNGRQCVSYVYRVSASWHFLEATCGLPGQLSPLVGHDATVHVPGNCANVRDQANLNGTVVGCLHDGTTVHIDGGPNYADGRLWWHEAHGWMAHDFLTGP
jgi:hypothetical protein